MTKHSSHCKYLFYSTIACSTHCESDEERKKECAFKLHMANAFCPSFQLEKIRDEIEDGNFDFEEVLNSDLYLTFDKAPRGYARFAE